MRKSQIARHGCAIQLGQSAHNLNLCPKENNMKLINLLLILAVAVSCEKVNKSTVSITIKDKNTGALLPNFSYKIMTHGLGGMQTETQKTGTIENGFTSFHYTTVKNRLNEVTVHSDSLKGYFPNYGFSQNITEKNRDLVFEFVPLKNLKIIATNTNCFNADDNIFIKVYKESDSPYADAQSTSRTGCLNDQLVFDKPLTADKYIVEWKVTRNTIITEESTEVELTELTDQTIYINY